MDIDYQTRLIDLYEWHAGFVASNVALIGLDQADIDTAVSCVGILGEALAEIYSVPAAATAWDGVFVQLQAELEPYTNLGPQWGLEGSVQGSSAAADWTPRAMVVGKSYVNPKTGHKYTVTAITVDRSCG
ncbi:hypothetical protein [Candidatus Aalborgicola defluviihabitans]|uniref:hypothetical protein n=1 Tax=Candidatus Aalborgicola defluviihabitans TaxID=3386187 RepID=UPI001E0AC749|nr:hypothetical protein [Burkholderiales bacterium]